MEDAAVAWVIAADVKNKTKRRHDMPGRDGTGPMGAGAMTGRGLGPCGGGYAFGRGFGGGFGRGLGRGGMGFGWRRTAAPAMGPTKETLEEQVGYLESLLKDARESLERMDGKK